jgi:DNA-binding transcriptional regulator GbsR (MarR family)
MGTDNSSAFGGILGNGIIIKIIQEFIADPDEPYSISYMHELTEASKPAITDAFKTLLKTGLIYRANKNYKRPLYKINKESKKFVALSLLSYAALDDMNKTNTMDKALTEYIGNKMEIA